MLYIPIIAPLLELFKTRLIDVKNERIDSNDSDYGSQVKLILAFGNNQPLTPRYTSAYINGDYIVRLIKDFMEPK